MRKNCLLVFAAASLIFIGCSKEKSVDSTAPTNNNNNSGDIIGKWKYVSSHVQTRSLLEYKEFGVDMATDTYSDYVTINNSGTVTITTDKFNSANMSYGVDAIAKGYLYEDGQLLDSLEFPFVFTLPPTTSGSTYKKVGSDSLYFAAGGFVNVGGSANPNTPGGAKYRIEGDKLYMTSKYYNKGTETQQGITATKTDYATVETTLQRQ